MNSVVLYASHSGNTRIIAEAIAGTLDAHGPVRLVAVEELSAGLPPGTDLLVIGSATEAHRMLEPLARFFARLAPGALRGVAAAAFDTRLRGPGWLWGSAAAGIARALGAAGALVIAPAESFYVNMTPTLQPGELERAWGWAEVLAAAAALAVAPGRDTWKEVAK